MSRLFAGAILLVALALGLPRPVCAQEPATAVEALANLADPAKLATLGALGANPRARKIVYWLAVARTGGQEPGIVIDAALAKIGWEGSPKGELTKAAFLRNLGIADRLGCLDAEGLDNLRRGRAPVIRAGPYANDKLSVDHIIPRSAVPELDNVLANLELMPLHLNRINGGHIGQRQIDTAQKFSAAGLMTPEQVARLKTDAHLDY